MSPTTSLFDTLDDFRSRKRYRVVRECVAFLLWGYWFTKALVFDIDNVLVMRLAPRLLWVLDYRSLILVIVVLAAWYGLGHKQFLVTVGYIGLYPVMLLAWRLPKKLYNIWPSILVLSPLVIEFLGRLRYAMTLCLSAIIAALVITFGTNRIALIASMAVLGTLLVLRFVRALRGALSASMIDGVVRMARKTRRDVKSGEFENGIRSRQSDVIRAAPRSAQLIDLLSQMYFFYALAHYLSDKVSDAAKDRWYEALLIAALLYTVFLTSIIYALEYLALSKLDTTSFRNATDARLWDYFAYSLSILSTSSISAITTSSRIAQYLAASELFASIFILIVLVFTLFSVARETYRKGIDDVATELRYIARAIEQRWKTSHRRRVAQLERELLERGISFVNSLRKLRGLHALTVSSVDDPSQSDALSPRVHRHWNRSRRH